MADVGAIESLILGRELFGMDLGLARMRRLVQRLGDPQRQFRAIHVVGTNGKTSTARFAAAMVAAHGVRVGAYLSPHVRSWSERVQVDGDPIVDEAFGSALIAAETEARSLDDGPDGPITQFELLTAAAFVAFAEAGVEVAVIEAGLGGRHDATNVLEAPVVLLTSIALDHVAQLGSTRLAIAGEKLAVVTAGATLVVGFPDAELRRIVDQVDPPAGSIEVVTVPLGSDCVARLAAAGSFQRRNAAVALAGVEALLGPRFRRSSACAAAAAVRVPGRLETVGTRPLVLLDGAHNPDGARSLAIELEDATGGLLPRVGVLAILADKDVAGICSTLVPSFDLVVATASTSPRAFPAGALADTIRAVTSKPVSIVVPPALAVAAAIEAAGPGGSVVVCGSLSLLADIADAVAGDPG